MHEEVKGVEMPGKGSPLNVDGKQTSDIPSHSCGSFLTVVPYWHKAQSLAIRSEHKSVVEARGE